MPNEIGAMVTFVATSVKSLLPQFKLVLTKALGAIDPRAKA